MHCVMCGRPMLRAAVQVGRMALGPKCAVKAGLIQPKSRQTPIHDRFAVVRDKRTADMFAEAT